MLENKDTWNKSEGKSRNEYAKYKIAIRPGLAGTMRFKTQCPGATTDCPRIRFKRLNNKEI